MEDNAPEKLKSPETLDPKSIVVVTGTFYPSWYPGKVRGELTSDKLRGDLALRAFEAAKIQKFRIVLVDEGSPKEFLDEAAKLGVQYEIEQVPSTQGSARRQGLQMVQNLSEVKIICETEPEKISVVRDCLKIAAKPIAQNEADIVVPKRSDENFQTLPEYQARAEKRANKMYNQILRAHNLLRLKDPDIDFWFGVRVFANRPEVVDLFKKRYEFTPDERALHKIVRPDTYSNPLEFPIVNALHEGLRVKSVEVNYVHPKEQTKFEEGKEEFNRKRDIQRRTIITELLHFIRYLEESPKSRISKNDISS